MISCEKTKQKNYAHFGGVIINPKSNFVVLFKDEKLVDTIRLNSKNQFLRKLDNLKEGLYKFKHGSEFQYIYFQDQDSILIRLNTWNFDHSLVFTGKGSTKNEFLMSKLKNETHNFKNISHYYNLNSSKFHRIIDSIEKNNYKDYNSFIEQNPDLSDDFKIYAQASISYPLARAKELYPMIRQKRMGHYNYDSISPAFYNFRIKHPINNTELTDFYPFTSYVIAHLYNKAYYTKYTNKVGTVTSNMLHIIQNNIEDEEFKNQLLSKVMFDDFTNENSCGISDKEFNIFKEYCTNEKYIASVENMVLDSRKVVNEKPLTNFDVLDMKGNPKHIKNIINNKNTVIYFWSDKNISSEFLYKRISYLERLHPQFDFIGINIQSDKNITNNAFIKKINSKNQYQLSENSIAHSFVTSNNLTRTIIISDGIVKNNYANFGSKKLSDQLNNITKK